MREQVATQDLAGLYLDDDEGALAHALQAETTTEVFVVDQANTLIYRGAVSDQYGLRHALEEPRERYLEAALDAAVRGHRPRVAATSAPGCLINPSEPPDAAPLPVTYSRDIARVMQNNCIECHRSGGIAPFSLESYRDVARRAKMIDAVIDEGLMPPWSAASPPDGPNPWHNDRSLTEAETEAIRAWLEAGTPEGDPAGAPAPLDWPETEWTIGEPDATFQLPEPIAVQAEGVMPYEHVIVPMDLKEDKWVQAFQVVPSAPEVVHHVLVFVAPREALEDRRQVRRAISGTGGHLAAYVPGNDSVVYPEGLARQLPADAVLVFQLHYTPNGTATEDQTRIGFRFANEPPRHVVRTRGIANTQIRIPAGASRHQERAEAPVPRDAKLLAFMPHMHVRGKAFRYELERPEGERELLLDVPRYDFNWQLRYAYREPVSVPRGSTLHVTAEYDNSADNPANPDPTSTVTWGPQTHDEMLLGYVEFYFENEDPAEAAAAAEAQRRQSASDRPGRPRFAQLLERFDADEDGALQRSEVPKQFHAVFDRLDRDGDGMLTSEEFERAQR